MKTLKFLTIAIAIFLTTKTYAQRGGGGSFTTVVDLTVTNETDPIANCQHEIALLVDYNFNGTAYTQISNTVSMNTSGQSVLLTLTIPVGSTITAKKVKFTKSGATTLIHDLSHTMNGDNIYGYCSNDTIIYEQPSGISSTSWYYFLTIFFP